MAEGKRHLPESPSRDIRPHFLTLLRSAFARLERLEGHPGEYSDEAWSAHLSQRETADPLSDHSWYAGYLVGISDALGFPVAEVVRAARATKPRKRVVEIRRRRTG